MLASITNLKRSEFNRSRRSFALRRLLFWKYIRFFKLTDVIYPLWENCKIYLNYDSFQSMWIMYNYIVDWEEFNLIANFVKPDQYVFDIGANMGFYTIWMSKFAKGEQRIHSFEPDKRNFKRLEKNITLNKLENSVKPNQLAVSDTNGVVAFSTGLDGENHLLNTKTDSSTEVSTITLDSYANEIGIDQISYLKIDVEGFEYFVLKGAENLLNAKKITIIQIEINQTLANSGKSASDILDLLSDKGYFLCDYDVKANKLRPVGYVETKENYLAVASIDAVNNQLTSKNVA